jgi:hypothetical protein
MHFKLNMPSIPAIRARFLIEKLRDFQQESVSICLCATGRTHSGKTTLGNSLIGIEYFMPSTGKQDCTDEVNLIEFPIGLKYFDLPGVCSDDHLENYNRAALGIKQIDEFDLVNKLTLATYAENQSVQRQVFNISEFQAIHFNPDLIFYLIAPDKLFLAIDKAYLKDLLKKYSHKVIYVFNMFADKESGGILSATEQNIADVRNAVQKTHNSVLGEENLPVIVHVNCWTGEGIYELIEVSYQTLGVEKGFIFEKIIAYQQQKTPDEYLRLIKHELIRLFSYIAYQKPEGTYTCDQSIHKACYQLWEFLNPFRAIDIQPTDSFKDLATKFHDRQSEIFQKELVNYKNEIQSLIEIFEPDLQKQKNLEKEVESLRQQLGSEKQQQESLVQEINLISRKRDNHEKKFDRATRKRKKLLKKRNKYAETTHFYDSQLENYNDILENKRRKLKKHKKKFKKRDKQVNFKQSRLKSLQNSIEELADAYATKTTNLVNMQLSNSKKVKGISEKKKLYQEYSQFVNGVLTFSKNEFTSISTAMEADSYMAKMTINKLIIDILLQCTTYHFDHTVECTYKGSTYNYFGTYGITLLLMLTEFVISNENLEKNYQHKYKKIELDHLNLNILTEIELQELLEHEKKELLFNNLFDEAIKKVGLYR